MYLNIYFQYEMQLSSKIYTAVPTSLVGCPYMKAEKCT